MEENVLVDNETTTSEETTNIPSSGLRRLHMENVQSVADLTLDFDEKGVYRLVGDNDVGKSAILRGMNALFHNVSRSSYKEYISDWADTFIVEGWFYDGGYVKLSRGANDYYEWSLPDGSNGTVLKTDGKVPKEVEEYFNLYYEKDKTKTTLNFNLQGDILPFVDTTTSDNYWLTQKALGTNLLLNASKIVKSELRDYEKTVKTLADSIEYEENIKLNIQNEIENDEDELQTLETGLKVIQEELVELEEIDVLFKKEAEVQLLMYSFNNLSMLSEREISELSTTIKEFSLIEKYMNDLIDISGFVEKLTITNEIIENFDLENLDLKEKEYRLLNDFYIKWSESNKLEQKLTTINIIEEDILKDIDSKDKELKSLEDYLIKMKQFRQSEEEVENLISKSSSLDEQLLVTESELTALIEEEKVCPVCGNDLLTSKIHTHKE